MKTNGWKVFRITDIALKENFEKQILLLEAKLNDAGIYPSKDQIFGVSE